MSLEVLGGVVVAIISAIILLAVALARTREHLVRLDALVEELRKWVGMRKEEP